MSTWRYLQPRLLLSGCLTPAFAVLYIWLGQETLVAWTLALITAVVLVFVGDLTIEGFD